MYQNERALESAEAFDQEERDRRLHRVHGDLAGKGSKDCADCGEPIPARRRAAMPSATRCITCQEKSEGARA